jgi:hypothetical protein
MQRDYEAAKKETVGTGFEPTEDPEVMQQVAKYSDEQLAGMQSAIEAKELEASAMDVGIAGMEKGAAPAKFLTTTEFRDQEREKQTTPGMTSREFFESKLPGFEERYKESPFFRLEQQRKEQEEEREQMAKRRPLLRTGGRGRTVVTRGRA